MCCGKSASRALKDALEFHRWVAVAIVGGVLILWLDGFNPLAHAAEVAVAVELVFAVEGAAGARPSRR
jgi:hypothetical protein